MVTSKGFLILSPGFITCLSLFSVTEHLFIYSFILGCLFS